MAYISRYLSYFVVFSIHISQKHHSLYSSVLQIIPHIRALVSLCWNQWVVPGEVRLWKTTAVSHTHHAQCTVPGWVLIVSSRQPLRWRWSVVGVSAQCVLADLKVCDSGVRLACNSIHLSVYRFSRTSPARQGKLEIASVCVCVCVNLVTQPITV